MRLLLSALIFFLFVSMPPRSQAASDNGSPPDRAHSLVNTFSIMCTLELPNFDHIDAKATAMRMQLQAMNTAPSAEGSVTRSKTWVGNLTTGPFALLVDEMSGPKGKATSCAVIGGVPDVDDFRAEAINAIKLPTAPQPEIGKDGSRSFVWDQLFGPGTTFIIRDFKPSGKPGVMLKVLTKAGGP
jgi:hypothetical protein